MVLLYLCVSMAYTSENMIISLSEIEIFSETIILLNATLAFLSIATVYHLSMYF